MIARGLQEGRTVGKSYRPTDLWTRRLNDAKIDAATSGAQHPNSPTTAMFPLSSSWAFPTDSLDNNKVLFALAQFNISKFTSRNFDIQQDRNNGLTQFRVQGFRSFKDVHYYAQQLYANPQLRALFRMARTELISVANLRLLGTVVSFEDYRKFYNTHFAPLKIKPYLPLEFETEDTPKQIYEDETSPKTDAKSKSIEGKISAANRRERIRIRGISRFLCNHYPATRNTFRSSSFPLLPLISYPIIPTYDSTRSSKHGGRMDPHLWCSLFFRTHQYGSAH